MSLPAICIAGSNQCLMHFGVHVGVHVSAMVLERLTQGQEIGFIGLCRQQCQSTCDSLIGRFAQGLTLRGVHFGDADFGRFGGFSVGTRCAGIGLLGASRATFSRRNSHRLTATRNANFFSPDRHRWQSLCFIVTRCFGLRQGALKGYPYAVQLMTGCIQLGREFQINAMPCSIYSERMGLLQPLRHVCLQNLIGRIGFFQTFGGQHFNALGQQHGRLTLHHHLMLQIFNRFDFFCQLRFQACQGFA